MAERMVNYIARREAHQLAGELFYELPTGTDVDDLQFSLELFLSGFSLQCQEDGLTGHAALKRLRRQSRTIYFAHFWQIGHTPYDQFRQRNRIELALLETWHPTSTRLYHLHHFQALRLCSFVYTSRHRN